MSMVREVQQRLQEKGVPVFPDDLATGIDVGQSRHEVAMARGDGLFLGRRMTVHSRAGLEGLYRDLEELRSKYGLKRVVVGLEPTGPYAKVLVYHLQRRGFLVVLLNPLVVRRSREAEDLTRGKTDRKDARIILRLVREGKGRLPEVLLSPYDEGRALAREHGELISSRSRLKNRLWSLLQVVFPEYTLAFKDILGKTSRAALSTTFLPEEIDRLGPEGFWSSVRQSGGRWLARRKVLFLYQLAKDSIGVPGQGYRKAEVRRLLERLKAVEGQIGEIEGKLIQVMGAEETVARMATVPGVGLKTASLLAGHAGDIRRLNSGKELVKLAGLDPMPNQSGKKQGKGAISRRGRAGLRLTLYQTAWAVIRVLPQFRAYYWHLRTRPNNPLEPDQALAAVANKLGRVAYMVAVGKEPFRAELVAWGSCM